MKIIIIIITTILVTLLAAELIPKLWEESPYIETTLHSKILNEEREIVIRLPKNYSDKNKEYDVIYKLDGTSRLWRWDDALNILSSVDFADEMIVVAIPNTSETRNRDYTPPYMKQNLDDESSEMGSANKFLNFIEMELIPFVDLNYRTTNVKILNGHSRGGLFVLYSFLEKPDLFEGRFGLSPAFWREENIIVHKTKSFLVTQDSFNSFFYFNLGDKENKKMTQAYVEMQKVFENSNVNSKNYLFEKALNGNHQSTPIIAIPFAIKAWTNFNKLELNLDN